MKKQYIQILCAGLIGIFGVAYSNDTEAQKQPVFANITTGSVVTEQQAEQKLVPFDQALFQACCDVRQKHYQWALVSKLITLSVGSAIIGYNLKIMSINSLVLMLKLRNGSLFTWSTYEPILSAFWNKPWYSKIGNILGEMPTALWRLFQTGSGLMLVHSTLNAVGEVGNDFNAYMSWLDREDFSLPEKQQIWHTEVFERLGKPEVIGVVPITGKYWFKCEKANSIMHETFDFDPFNAAHIKELLLGVKDMRCTRIVVKLFDAVR